MSAVVTKLNSGNALAELAVSFQSRAEESDRLGRPSLESLAEAARLGFHALTVPRGLGGGGANLVETVATARRLGAADPAATLILAMTWIQHAATGFQRRWPEKVYREIVQDTVAGRGLINALRVEPELGTVMRGGLPATTARRTEAGWQISGRKIYSTGASVLNWYNVYARTDEENPRVGYFLIRAASPGIRIEETWDHLGMRATDSHDVVFDNVSISYEYGVDIRPLADWNPTSASHAAWFSMTVSAIYLGIADAARDWLISFLQTRAPTNLGKPLATLERMQLALGEIEALRTAAGLLLSAIAYKVDAAAAGLTLEEAGLVKHVISEHAIEIVQKAVALIGNPALTRAHPLERHLRDVLCARVHSPQCDSTFKSAGIAALRSPEASIAF